MAAAAALLLVPMLAASPGDAQVLDDRFWGINNAIGSIERSGNTVYVSGNFRQVGSNRGCGVVLDASTGHLRPGMPRVTGWVRAVVPDGDGGWFIGGAISGAGGLPRSGLAHILADGRVADWAPMCDGEVFTLLLHGGVLYAGGSFTHINAIPRTGLVALDPATGAVLGWDPHLGGTAYALLARDTTLLVGGVFSTVGGADRNGLAEVSLASGEPTLWTSTSPTGLRADIRTLCIVGDVLFVGGKAIPLAGSPRWGLGAIHLATGTVLPWAPEMENSGDRYDESAYVARIAQGSGTIYVAGHFRTLAGQPREGLAEFDVTSGALTSWAPVLGPIYPWIAHFNYTLVVTDSTVMVGGTFREVGGQARDCIAEIHRSTAQPTAWNPRANDNVLAMARAGNAVFAGGWFTFVGDWQSRVNVAALDATTGRLRDWNPEPSAEGIVIWDTAAYGDRLYVSGDFGNIGGQERYYLTALDTLTGEACEWDPRPDLPAQTMKVADGRLYLSGDFQSIGGVPRKHLASFDLATGALTDWDPHPDSYVSDFIVSKGVVHICGMFRSVRGVPRIEVAAIDAETAALLDWNPPEVDGVLTLAIKDSILFLGGLFASVGNQPRASLAAVHATTGAVLDWRADASHTDEFGSTQRARIYSLAVVGDVLYVGGLFDTINGTRRAGLAALDAITGAVLPWDPGLMDPFHQFPLDEAVIYVIAPHGDGIYVGGRFRSAGATPVTSLALFPGVLVLPPPPPDQAALESPRPNPATSFSRVRFVLPSAGRVTLEVLDVQGRRMTFLLRDEARSAGTHDVVLSTNRWPEGVYFCRLLAGTGAFTEKLVVVR